MAHLPSLIAECFDAQAAKAAPPPAGIDDDDWIDIQLDRLETSGRQIAATPASGTETILSKIDIALVRIAEDEADGMIRNDVQQALIVSVRHDLQRLAPC
jgi:hypothetical protein